MAPTPINRDEEAQARNDATGRRMLLESRAKAAYQTFAHRVGDVLAWEQLTQRARDAWCEVVNQVENSDYIDNLVIDAEDEALANATEEGPECPVCEAKLTCPNCHQQKT